MSRTANYWLSADRPSDNQQPASAVVFVHPTTPEATVLPGIPEPIEDYPADTTQVALHLVVAGRISRFLNVKVILSHGGGFLLYAASGFAELTASLTPGRSVNALLDEVGLSISTLRL